jgi:hypothetical protein
VPVDSKAAKEKIFYDEAVNVNLSITVRKKCPQGISVYSENIA